MFVLESCVQSVTGERVVLADRRTILNIGKVSNVELAFTDQYLEEHTSAVTLHVLDMPGIDLIIGFPDIITKYYFYFLNVIADIHEKVQKPWTSGEDGQEESPEDQDTLSFAGPLYYIMNEREKVLQDYYTLFNKHLAPGMVKAVPGIADLLKCGLALQVFVPEVWKGIKGFKPLELKIKDTMPRSL